MRIGPFAASRVSKSADYPIPSPVNGTNAPPNIEQSLQNQGMGWQLPFPPGHPLYPYFGYGAEPRQFDYQTGANITVRPRSGRISFDTLRAFTTTWDVARMCIAHRINSIRSFDWAIVPADGEEGDSDIDLALQTGRKAIEKPDGRLPYKRWLAKALNSRLRYDALTLYKRRDMLGRVMALEVIDGTCYSDDTEVLTRSGWKRFADADQTDEFATRNQDTHAFEWQAATHFTEYDWAGREPLYNFKSRTLDLLVTGNHRMLVTSLPRALGGSRHRESGEVFVPACELAENRSRRTSVPATSEWAARELTSFRIPEPGKRAHLTEISGDDFAAFMGMWLAEGSLSGQSDYVFISQRQESKGYEDFRSLLTRMLGNEPGYDGNVWRFKSRALANYLRQFGHAPDKFVPAEVLGMSRRQLAIFWRFYMLGDGCYADKRETIVTVSRQMADDLQEIAQKLGGSASVRTRKARGEVTIDGRVVKAENQQVAYCVRLRHTAEQIIGSVDRVPYDGHVYCVSVPNETLYVRRNGQPAWCGNTIAPMLDYYGRLPVGDAPAYLQFANGVPWDWMADRDVIYAPYFPQEDSPYGWAPIEDVIAVANIDERMTLHLLEYWNTSNLPAGWLEAPESWDDPAKLDDFQARLNAKLMGDQQKKVQAHVVPQGTKFTPIRSESFDTDAYLWGFRKGCAAFGVVPSDLGVTLDINKATGETQIDVQSRIADRPMCEDLDGLITSYLQDDLGLPVKMQTSYSAEKEDRVADANVWKIGTEGGAVTVDEWRSEMFGLDVDSDRPVPRFIMSSRAGPIPLANLFAIAGPINPATGGPLDTVPLLDTGKKPFEAAAGVAPGKTLNTPGALVSPFNPDEPQFPQDELAATPAPTTIAAVAKSETAGITSETGLVGMDLLDDEDDEDDRVAIQKELGRWRDFARNRVKTGKPIRPFVSTVIPADVSEHITKALVGCASRAQVDAAFAEAAKSANPFSRANPTAAVAYPGSVAVRKAKHPTDALLDQIVGHYAPLVGQALASALPSQSRLAQGNLTPADLDLSQIQAVLTEATTDAWVGGALIAAATVPAKVTKAGPTNLSANQQGSLPPSMADTDWGAWTPGWAGAAATISDPGLDAVLSGLGFTLKGIASSTIDQIGSQIAQGVASGASMDSIAMGLRDSVGGDASRAYTIADTECARAAQSASMQTYAANGIEMLDWLVADDPCDDCQANADGGPYTVDAFPDLPQHPRCRCSSSPNVDALVGGGSADESEPVSDEGDE